MLLPSQSRSSPPPDRMVRASGADAGLHHLGPMPAPDARRRVALSDPQGTCGRAGQLDGVAGMVADALPRTGGSCRIANVRRRPPPKAPVAENQASTRSRRYQQARGSRRFQRSPGRRLGASLRPRRRIVAAGLTGEAEAGSGTGSATSGSGAAGGREVGDVTSVALRGRPRRGRGRSSASVRARSGTAGSGGSGSTRLCRIRRGSRAAGGAPSRSGAENRASKPDGRSSETSRRPVDGARLGIDPPER